jgi:hypothetical protein
MQWAIGLVVEAVGGPDGYRLALLGTGALTLLAALCLAWAGTRVGTPGRRPRAATAPRR